MEDDKMDKYIVFDNYIKGKMNDSEIKSFEESLESDKELAKEFQLYLTTVSSVIKEEEQDCMDFAHAMKNIRKEELSEIIEEKKIKVRRLIPLKASILSTAAAVLIMFGATNLFLVAHYEGKLDNSKTEFGYKMDNAIFALVMPNGLTTRGGETIDINDGEKLKEKLPKAIESYKNAEKGQEELMAGQTLALIYVKLHERDKARVILQSLIEKYKEDEDYSHFTKRLEIILQQITD